MAYILIKALFLLATIGQIQENNLATGKVSYFHMTYLEAPNESNGRATLYFNKEISVYIHNDAPKQSSVIENGMQLIPIPGDEEGFPVYKNLKEKEILYKRMLGGNISIIKDKLEKIEWILTKEKKIIGNYDCQKAVGRFGGRDYEVWFTIQIPVQSGPYKLWGLPGLILEAKSLDGKVEFLFNSLEISENIDYEMSKPQNGRFFESYEEFKIANEKRKENLEKLMRSRGVNLTISKSTNDWHIEKEHNDK